MQFPLESRVEKMKWIHPTHHSSLWIVLWNRVINSSILLEFFSFVSKCLSWNREKTAELKRIKMVAKTGSTSATPQL